MRTLGIEEECFLIDHATCRPSPVVPDLHRELRQVNIPGTTLDTELMASQIEVVTEICSEGAQALQALFERRQVLSEICARHGYRLIAAGTPPCLPEARLVYPSPRYQQLQDFVPAIVRDHFVSGLHVHIGIDSPAMGVRMMSHLRLYLPMLAAVAANSPLWEGAYSGFESWRTINYRRWSVTGIPPLFQTLKEYEQHRHALLNSGALLDHGHIGWAVRLSAQHPTVEVRVADSQMTTRESVGFSLLVRALAQMAEEAPTPRSPRDELLELELWTAAKYGLSAPFDSALALEKIDKHQMMRRLLSAADPALERNGDEQVVRSWFEFLKVHGNGAQRQRQSFDGAGIEAVVHEGAKWFVREPEA